jgi:negative regulator of flagellin synthesis FlgM
MSREVDFSNRAAFFPNSKTANNTKVNKQQEMTPLNRNTMERMNQLQGRTAGDAKVQISDAIKDFSRIKSAVDKAPSIDNSDKIAKLKSQIQRGEYRMDYDAIADKMLSQEF